MNTETEKLLSLIYQANGQIKVETGQLFVAPIAIAQRFGGQIKKLKPEILIALGCCPTCAKELVVKIEETRGGIIGRHEFCSGSEPGHYDSWKF